MSIGLGLGLGLGKKDRIRGIISEDRTTKQTRYETYKVPVNPEKIRHKGPIKKSERKTLKDQ